MSQIDEFEPVFGWPGKPRKRVPAEAQAAEGRRKDWMTEVKIKEKNKRDNQEKFSVFFFTLTSTLTYDIRRP